jgi:hypothetical protein
MKCILLSVFVGGCVDCKNMHGMSNVKLWLTCQSYYLVRFCVISLWSVRCVWLILGTFNNLFPSACVLWCRMLEWQVGKDVTSRRGLCQDIIEAVLTLLWLLDPEDDDGALAWNIDKYLPVGKPWVPEGLESASAPLREPQISHNVKMPSSWLHGECRSKII